MKHFNNNKKAQRGGLMIEALAMLGLIAVVTPTMYKKSAERALEVEDINTATTVRSYINAAESYIAANYISLLDQVEDGGVKSLTNADLQSFLPYQFNVANALYDYDTPKASVVRNGNNLTAFALFPAKGSGDDGLGQERTARIASLVGANGGYVTGSKTARGVGGIWNLDTTAYSKVFNGDDSPVYSLVTASSNVINGSSASAMVENTKYLQRTAENGEKWRNAMRTDIYMGGYEATDPDNKVAGLHSIRNINSLIVGAEDDIAADAKNGLYINKDGTNPNAYIGGTLKAAAENFFTDNNKMRYGKVDNTANYRFEVDKDGNVTNYGNIDMGTNLTENGYARLGRLTGKGKVNGTNLTANDYLFNGTTTQNGASVSLLTPNIFQITTDDNKLGTAAYNTHVLIEKTGYKGVDGVANKNSLGANITPSYTKSETFPVVVGSNMMVEGLLSAGQLDTQHLRTASLSTGSEHIDDQYKWLTVDKNGVVIQDTATGRLGTVARFNSTGVNLRTGQGASTELGNNAELAMAKDGENGHIHATAPEVVLKTQNATTGKITAKNANLGMQLKGKEITIGDKNTLTADTDITNTSGYRVVAGKGGNVDLVGSNFKVIDQNNKNILTIRGNADASNKSLESGYDNNYNDFINNPSGANPVYNMAAHGNVLFTSMSAKSATEAKTQDSDDTIHYLAMGPNDTKAAVNIAEGSEGTTASRERLVFVDLSSKDANAYVNAADNKLKADTGTPETYEMQPGSIYIRKGLMEVVPNKAEYKADGSSTLSANSGTGIIRAGRLVANNVDASGNAIAVPKSVTDTAYGRYNGTSHANRYDTYMVNPAYTSVMKDIKLTTRGGARLSDVLPDFITKALYVATNTYDDTVTKMEFQLGNTTTFDLVNPSGSEKWQSTDNTDWSSPFMGLAPAPQCPPGYGRVITVAPAGFMMAQAGNMSFSDIGGPGGIGPRPNGSKASGNSVSYFVDERAMSSKLQAPVTGTGTSGMTNQANLRNAMTPEYRQLQVNGSGTADVTVSGENKSVTINSISGVSVGTSYDTYSMGTETGGSGASQETDITTSNTSTYVLSSVGDGALPPLVFQQSTWLKTLAVPVYNGTKVDYDSTIAKDMEASDYGRGWAILMGFLYPQDLYGNIICGLAPNSSTSCQNASYVGSNHTDVYWNIFPVKKNTLEAFVTTYCYFDRTNIFGGYNTSGTGIDTYDTLSNVPTSFEKVGNADYLKSLNDPTLKYNEVW